MPLLVFRQPIFSIARVLYRPLLSWLGLALTSSSIYNVLWTFAGHVLTNIGFVRGVMLLFSVRRYIFGGIGISTLGNIINAYNPILGSVFNTVVRHELIRIARQSITTQIGFRRLINIIIINSFLLIFKNIIKFIFKYFFLIIISLLGVFWLGIFNNVSRLLTIAFEVKDFLENRVLPLGLKIPVPANISRPYPWLTSLVDGINYYYNLKYGFPSVYFPYSKVVDKIPYVRKFSNPGGYESNQNASTLNNRLMTEDYLVNKTIVSSITENVNNSIVNHDVVEVTDFLIHLFNEFNLFC